MGKGMGIRKALEKANKRLMAKIDDAMTKEVFEKVRDVEVDAINSVVYGAGVPKEYNRRYKERSGLGDPNNIQIRDGAAQGGRMAVVNVTAPNPGDCVDNWVVTTDKKLPELVEYGHGYNSYYYDIPLKWWYMQPRPFTAKTIEHLKQSGAHVTALKAGLKRQGVNVK